MNATLPRTNLLFISLQKSSRTLSAFVENRKPPPASISFNIAGFAGAYFHRYSDFADLELKSTAAGTVT